MQYLQISDVTTLEELTAIVGKQNIDNVLAINKLRRSADIGKQFKEVCKDTVREASDVAPNMRKRILSDLVQDSDIFEMIALGNDDTWKLYADSGLIEGMIAVPDTVPLPNSDRVFGNRKKVGAKLFQYCIDSIDEYGDVDPTIFNEYDTRPHYQLPGVTDPVTGNGSANVFQHFHIPWGMVMLYSSLEDNVREFPVYPEEITDGVSANYTQMPDMLYQYEPWQVYQSSGPRSNTYLFHFHRDMWTGNHLDGKANDLIRFCEANCYPKYDGSAVHTSTVTLFVAGEPLITGVLNHVGVKWSGPIGLDGFYLECELELTITEVSQEPLDYAAVRSKSLIG